MKSNQDMTKTSIAARLKMALAGLALAGALAGGAVAIVDEPVEADDTTETAIRAQVKLDDRTFALGVSWR